MSDTLWDHPETGFHERYAAELYGKTLEQEGFQVERELAGIPTAFSGTYGQGGPVIGFLGEFDALPGLSQAAGADEKRPVEENGPGHGCGHNLLGVGSLAARHRPEALPAGLRPPRHRQILPDARRKKTGPGKDSWRGMACLMEWTSLSAGIPGK